MRHGRSIFARNVVRILWAVPLFAACAASPDHGRFARHFEAPVLGGAMREQWNRPDRALPEFALLATVPVAFELDADLHEDRPAKVSSYVKTSGDTLPIALGVGAMAVAGLEWAGGDDAREFEAAGEALGLTGLATEVIKNVAGRKRPDSRSSTSFLSGHTSFAFAATTVLLRELEDDSDDRWNPMELVYYAPAVFVATERVRADRHWTSDVASGAFLGVVIANWVWDAHFGREPDRRTIYSAPSKVSYRVGPGSVDGQPTFGLSISF